jgi:glutamate-1-semialdehyde 2,1-aminomutase
MERVAPAGDVYQAGTLSGNPLAVAAALVTLNRLDQDAYLRLEAVTRRLADGLREAAASAGRHIRIQSACGLVTPFFTTRHVSDYDGAASSDQEAYGAWCRALLARGVYPPASQFEAWFPSLAHSDEDIAVTVAAAAEAFEEVAAA